MKGNRIEPLISRLSNSVPKQLGYHKSARLELVYPYCIFSILNSPPDVLIILNTRISNNVCND